MPEPEPAEPQNLKLKEEAAGEAVCSIWNGMSKCLGPLFKSLLGAEPSRDEQSRDIEFQHGRTGAAKNMTAGDYSYFSGLRTTLFLEHLVACELALCWIASRLLAHEECLANLRKRQEILEWFTDESKEGPEPKLSQLPPLTASMILSTGLVSPN